MTRDGEDSKGTWILLFSGTARVFVQSAGVMTLALCMRDYGFIGSFLQTKAAAALCLLPLPFEALAASGCCRLSTRLVPAGTVLIVVLIYACTLLEEWRADEGQRIALVALEQALLLFALAFAVPVNVSKLYRTGNLEESLVLLEWLKAYLGRLSGPAFAIMLQNWLGYGPLLLVLCCATVTVALTA